MQQRTYILDKAIRYPGRPTGSEASGLDDKISLFMYGPTNRLQLVVAISI